jgi:beta-galactosidase beta subunit
MGTNLEDLVVCANITADESVILNQRDFAVFVINENPMPTVSTVGKMNPSCASGFYLHIVEKV